MALDIAAVAPSDAERVHWTPRGPGGVEFDAHRPVATAFEDCTVITGRGRHCCDMLQLVMRSLGRCWQGTVALHSGDEEDE